MSWNEEKVSKLKELWGKGSTASQIAEIIGGISRNAVIGKAHRLNLSSKIKTRNVNPQRRRLPGASLLQPAAPRAGWAHWPVWPPVVCSPRCLWVTASKACRSWTC